MDDAELFKMSGASAGTIAIVLLAYRIFKSVLGKRLVSNCCGRKMEVGIDIKDATTPVAVNPLVIRQISDEKNIAIKVEDARTSERFQESEEGRSHQTPSSPRGDTDRT